MIEVLELFATLSAPLLASKVTLHPAPESPAEETTAREQQAARPRYGIFCLVSELLQGYVWVCGVADYKLRDAGACSPIPEGENLTKQWNTRPRPDMVVKVSQASLKPCTA